MVQSGLAPTVSTGTGSGVGWQIVTGEKPEKHTPVRSTRCSRTDGAGPPLLGSCRSLRHSYDKAAAPHQPRCRGLPGVLLPLDLTWRAKALVRWRRQRLIVIVVGVSIRISLEEIERDGIHSMLLLPCRCLDKGPCNCGQGEYPSPWSPLETDTFKQVGPSTCQLGMITSDPIRFQFRSQSQSRPATAMPDVLP